MNRVLILPVILSSVPARAAVPDAPVLMRYKYHVGKTSRYALNMSMRVAVPGAPQTLEMRAALKIYPTVKSVDADGTANLEMMVTSAKGSINGRPYSSAQEQEPTRLRMTPTGRFKGFQGGAANQINKLGFGAQSNSMSSVLPDKPVRTGSSWITEGEVMGVKDLKLYSHLDRVTHTNGRTLAYTTAHAMLDMGKVLSKVLPGASLKGKSRCEIHSVFNLSAGVLQKVSGSFRFKVRGKDPRSGSPVTMIGGVQMAMDHVD
ncbi:MAG TPA: hypothetical protein VG944_24635 [Fimbriimonas sp.]|nr:hypothetical protein [Fimbriimonas sp.]